MNYERQQKNRDCADAICVRMVKGEKVEVGCLVGWYATKRERIERI